MRLYELLISQREQVVARWKHRLRSSITSQSVPAEYLTDSLPDFLDDLTEAAKVTVGLPGESDLPQRSTVAMEHGVQRFELGFDLTGIIREYGILRDCILELAEENGLSLTYPELRVLTQSVTTGAASAAEKYVALRDEQVRSLSAQHTAFLAHEVRNQIGAAVLSIASLEKRTRIAQERAFQLLQQSMKRMRELVDESLMASQLRAKPQIERRRLELSGLLEEVVQEIRSAAEGKQISLRLEHGPSPLPLEGDARLLYSALTNLVRNAVKFSREGGHVTVRARIGAERILVEVEDECGGIPQENIKRMFDPFVQLGRDRTGFGLGLAIAKQAAEAHNGDLRVHNIPGSGCIFILDLPSA